MLTTYPPRKAQTVTDSAAVSSSATAEALWIDLLNPTAEEIRSVEALLGAQLPTRNEAQEIEVSSRLYVENQTLFMTATIMVRADTAKPGTTTVTFAYQPRRLVTLRFDDPVPFQTFTTRLLRSSEGFASAQRLFLGLFDEIVDRIADILELAGSNLNAISELVFVEAPTDSKHSEKADYSAALARIGQNGVRAANARESLVSLNRIHAFFAESCQGAACETLEEHWKTAGKDVAALTDHATFISNKVNFFLDATLGRINSEQNTIIKLFSVLAVVLLPPTLIASIYGMNFEHMPELKWLGGYPMSLVMMGISAVLPYLFFKRKGWL